MRGPRCQAPALDADKRARLCGEPATAERDVPTGYGDETARLAFCEKHAAELDAEAARAPANDDGRALGRMVAVRLDAETLGRVDDLIPSLSVPGVKATRNDALRAVILAGLPVLEPPPARKRGER